MNVVLSADGEMAAASAGELEEAFKAAAARSRRIAAVAVEAPADIVVTTGGGYPLDATWYQAIKGLVAAIPAVRDGGTMILASGLREGIGSEDFTRLCMETTDIESFMRRIREPGVFLNEQWELEVFAHAARRARVMLYSDGMAREEQERLLVEPVASVEEGIARALADEGDDARILVMPHGPYVAALSHGYVKE